MFLFFEEFSKLIFCQVIRVDVTLDKGATWHTAELEQDNSQLNRCWSWSLWEVQIVLFCLLSTTIIEV